jgi:hypothetical protein
MKKMRVFYTASMIVTVSFLVTCSQQNVSDGIPLQANAKLAKLLTPKVGNPIQVDLAKTWITSFEQKYPSKAIARSHDVSHKTIAQLLAIIYADKEIDGLRFIKGFKETGEETLVVIPVQGGNDLWYLSYPGSKARANDSGTAYDGNGPITISTAKTWVTSYVNSNPGADVHKSYFVGREALKQMMNTSYNGKLAESLRFYKALNEINLETFVLAPVQNGETLGVLENKIHGTALRTKTDDVVYFEYLAPCPSTGP